jgi:putative transposase
MDNGPELIARALRDWCSTHAITTCCIEPGSPWENTFVESFNGRCRGELLNIHLTNLRGSGQTGNIASAVRRK